VIQWKKFDLKMTFNYHSLPGIKLLIGPFSGRVYRLKQEFNKATFYNSNDIHVFTCIYCVRTIVCFKIYFFLILWDTWIIQCSRFPTFRQFPTLFCYNKENHHLEKLEFMFLYNKMLIRKTFSVRHWDI